MNPADLRFFISLALRRLPVAIPLALLVAAVGIAVTLSLPAVYTTRATIAVESEQIVIDRDGIPLTPVEQVQTVEGRILSRASILEVAEEAGVFAATPGLSAFERVQEMRERITFEITSRRDQLTTFSISFDADDPEVSAAVVNRFTDRALAAGTELTNVRAQSQVDFFQDLADSVSGDLAEMQAEITAFKIANQDDLPDSLTYRRDRRAELQEKLLQLTRDEGTVRERIDFLEDAKENEREIYVAPATPAEARLNDLEDQLKPLLGVLSDTHPRVRTLQAQIAAQREIVEAQRGRGEGGDIGISSIDVQLRDARDEMERIDAEQAELEQEIGELNASISRTPRVAQELSVLDRRLDNLQTQFDQANADLAEATLKLERELRAKGQRFEVTETAVAPQEPTSPNRKLLAAVSLAAGMAAGGALVIVLELLNSTVRRPVEITRALGIETFATVPYIRTPRERAMRRVAIGAAAAATVAVVSAALWAVHTYYLPLDLLVERMMASLGLERELVALGLERELVALGLERELVALGLEREVVALGLEGDLVSLGDERGLI